MVGIVIVSHSSKVAEGIKDIISQMVKNFPYLEVVGGTTDGEIGTDPMAIQEAIEKVNDNDGVIVFADLGSAIMSIGIAKELLPEEIANNVYLANSPLIEGAIAATIEASLGSNLDKVLQTANDARNLDKTL